MEKPGKLSKTGKDREVAKSDAVKEHDALLVERCALWEEAARPRHGGESRVLSPHSHTHTLTTLINTLCVRI